MTGVAREAGVTREALYKSLSGDRDPRLATLLGWLRSASRCMPKSNRLRDSLKVWAIFRECLVGA